MKKTLTLLLMLLLLLFCTASASETTDVYVSISDGVNGLVLAYAPVSLEDADGDGALTIHDALMAAHAAYHPQGAAAYLAEKTEWGMSLYRLWNVENGGSYGYYLNDASAWSLMDTVQPGDHIKAYVFVDVTNFSDMYCFFDAQTVAADAGHEVSLSLTAAAFDANWNPVHVPVKGAVLTINGEQSEAVTDENGHALLTLTEAGTYVISAVSGAQTLVPPVCIVTITE